MEIEGMDDLSYLVWSGNKDWTKYGDVSAKYKDGLVLFNYTQQAQINGRWNWFERVSRGLILNENTGEVVARPFDKFFNWGERPLDADEHVIEASEKMDGSLGILYRHRGEYKIATRGSFDSDQAIWATQELHRIMRKADGVPIPENITLLFEIIYPENRVVVDYKGWQGLVLIGMRSMRTGKDYLYNDYKVIADRIGFSIAPKITFATIDNLLKQAETIDANQEGWVVRMDFGKRFKIKGDAYKLAHRLMTGVTFSRVLEAMAAGTLDDLIMGIPDEFLGTVNSYRRVIETIKISILNSVWECMFTAPKDRKEFAKYVKEKCSNLSPYMFAAFDKKDIMPLIYKHAFKKGRDE